MPKEKPPKRIDTNIAQQMIMSPVKRVQVIEPVMDDGAEKHTAGQTPSELLIDTIEDRKKRLLEEDAGKWHCRKKAGYVSLSEIND